MTSPTRPPTRIQVVLIALGFLAFAAWFFHDGITVQRTGRPIYFAHSKHSHNTMDAPECFMYSAGMTAIALALLGVASGVIKGRQNLR